LHREKSRGGKDIFKETKKYGGKKDLFKRKKK
jgi:hypothetical protein